ncbi:DUF3866 family protein [Aneurinibacillus aneurinilyticus]|uniref:DUF3866 family protein n=1 Tax=Aneurinibacillus aneurinilyticus TaxID=1391 RepID=A0A848CLL4_ANEAE|nr:DUF3866 family protein [Aneurinibacillus aneurinilyticus]NME96753.1 DUF3866 family protein [Aneurinibacillus aneurinilyticus]
MIVWSFGTVTRIVREEESVQELEVHIMDDEMARALNYPQLTGRIREGERVVLNTTAVDLRLGSGGKHFVSARIGVDGKPLVDMDTAKRYGHIMKLRYTPFQHAVQTVEEEESAYHEIFCDIEGKTLDRTPVIIGEVHSMLPAFVLSIRHLQRRTGGRAPRICYVMSEGGALPMALSEHVRSLRSLGFLSGTITYGHSFGGQTECVNLYTALLAARFVWKADMIVVMPGPGMTGTGTPLGFSGMEQVSILETAHKLGGLPILIPRVSLADLRKRHVGISHHTITVLQFARETPLVLNLEHHPELIAQLKEQSEQHTLIFHEPLDMEEWREVEERFPISIATMGRTAQVDLIFFAHAYYAARLAWIKYEKQEKMQEMDLFT